jgi:hypothetical protein
MEENSNRLYQNLKNHGKDDSSLSENEIEEEPFTYRDTAD